MKGYCDQQKIATKTLCSIKSVAQNIQNNKYFEIRQEKYQACNETPFLTKKHKIVISRSTDIHQNSLHKGVNPHEFNPLATSVSVGTRAVIRL